MASRAARLRALAAVLTGERKVTAATRAALTTLLAEAARALKAAGMDAAVLDSRWPAWRSTVDTTLVPPIEDVFTSAWTATQRGIIDPAAYATRHLEAVHNRLVGVSDTVFDEMRTALEEGRRAGESIPQLAARVDGLLADDERWAGRARTIARTEVIAANNAGARGAARATADLLGVHPGAVARVWLSTADGRTRETHAEADGQVVLGLDGTYTVGGADLAGPGDPYGPAEEVINCVVGSTQVEWPGQRVEVATRRRYRGDLIEVRTARGHYLTVTPNHPVLTPAGYVPAQALRPGQYVLATDAPPTPEVQDGPPSIEQVHRAALQGGTARRVRGRAVDFHGDGTDAEVEVVRADCDLPLDLDPEQTGKAHERILVWLRRALGFCANTGAGPGRLPLGRVTYGEQAAGTPRVLSRTGQRAPVLGGEAPHPDPVRLADSPDLQPQGFKASHDGGAADPEVVRHLQDALALGMTPCEVVQVDRHLGDTHVFNLQTTDAWYIGAGIAQHNCRCTELFYYPGDPEYDALAGTTSTPTALAAAAEENPVTTTPPETDPTEDTAEDQPADPALGVTHAGMAVQAADTGRILMIQRALDPEDPPDVQGTWEFPGGGIEDGEDALTAAWREFSEETGLPQPDGEVTATWTSDNGVYQGHVCTVPVEADAFAELNPDLAAAETVNPDDPQRRSPDVSAWFTVEQAQNLGPALRPEVAAMDWSVFAPAGQEDTMTQQTDAVAAAAGDPAPVLNAGDPAPPLLPDMEIPDADEMGDQFYGVAVVEDSQTGDGRVFAPGAIQWDTTPMPVPLGWQVQDAMGHDGAVVCGRVDAYMRFGNLIAYTGTWDLDGAGWETRRLVEGRFLTGVSVDTDDFDAEVVDGNGNPIDPMLPMMGEDDDAILLVTGARLRSHTMLRVPALVEAFIANGTPPQGWAGERPGAPVLVPEEPTAETPDTEAPEVPMPSEEAVTAALVAAAERAGNPPAALPAAEDFANPGLQQPTPVTVTDDGRVYGHIATWGTCHIGLDGCVTPPSSRAAYAYFLTGEVETTAGFIPVGQITMGTGHAATSLGPRPAAAHYDNTGFAVADVFCGEDEHGIWIAGRLRSDVPAAQVAALRAAGALSGDWRKIGGNLELVAALAVNVPGFPVPRLSVAASAGEPVALVAAGMVSPTPETGRATVEVQPGPDLVAAVYAAIDRRDRRRQAASRLDQRRAETRRARAAAARGRLAGRA